MVDKSNATDAASALIGAVHAEWASLPAKSRPRLVLFGEVSARTARRRPSEISRAWHPARTALCW
jgi:uncharacterized membrane protein